MDKMTSAFSRYRRTLRSSAILICALSGCTQLGAPPANGPIAEVEPAAATKVVAQDPAAKSPENLRLAAVKPKSGDAVTQAEFSVFYLERILLSEGLPLKITITGKGLKDPVVVTTKTSSAPPYAVKVDLPAGVTYPLTVEATLGKDGEGHNYSGKTTLKAAPGGVTEVRISPVLKKG